MLEESGIYVGISALATILKERDKIWKLSERYNKTMRLGGYQAIHKNVYICFKDVKQNNCPF